MSCIILICIQNASAAAAVLCVEVLLLLLLLLLAAVRHRVPGGKVAGSLTLTPVFYLSSFFF